MNPNTINEQLKALEKELKAAESELIELLEENNDDEFVSSEEFKIQVDYLSEQISRINQEMHGLLQNI